MELKSSSWHWVDSLRLGWEMVGLEVRDGTEFKLMTLGGFIESKDTC